MFVVIVVCCQEEVSATGRSPVQRSPTDCVVSLRVIKCNNPSTPNHGQVERGWTKKEIIQQMKIAHLNAIKLMVGKLIMYKNGNSLCPTNKFSLCTASTL
jgi:hypothetical protein